MRKVTAILLILYLLLVSACESNGQDVPQKGGMEQLGTFWASSARLKICLLIHLAKAVTISLHNFKLFVR